MLKRFNGVPVGMARGVLAALLLAIAACSSSPGGGPDVVGAGPRGEDPGPVPGGDPRTRAERSRVANPLHMQDVEPVRVALLLPFTGASEAVQKVASSMFDAAQLAAFEAEEGGAWRSNT